MIATCAGGPCFQLGFDLDIELLRLAADALQPPIVWRHRVLFPAPSVL
jgi:hypothetical protein